VTPSIQIRATSRRGWARKADDGKGDRRTETEIWVKGAARRESVYVGDLADALVQLPRRRCRENHVNVRIGFDVTIREVAENVMLVVGVAVRIKFDPLKVDGRRASPRTADACSSSASAEK
jgi:GDP-L-fucose synthase